jgi:hypothetical protein
MNSIRYAIQLKRAIEYASSLRAEPNRYSSYLDEVVVALINHMEETQRIVKILTKENR